MSARQPRRHVQPAAATANDELPAGWEKRKDSFGRVFFFERRTQRSSWTAPVVVPSCQPRSRSKARASAAGSKRSASPKPRAPKFRTLVSDEDRLSYFRDAYSSVRREILGPESTESGGSDGDELMSLAECHKLALRLGVAERDYARFVNATLRGEDWKPPPAPVPPPPAQTPPPRDQARARAQARVHAQNRVGARQHERRQGWSRNEKDHPTSGSPAERARRERASASASPARRSRSGRVEGTVEEESLAEVGSRKVARFARRRRHQMERAAGRGFGHWPDEPPPAAPKFDPRTYTFMHDPLEPRITPERPPTAGAKQGSSEKSRRSRTRSLSPRSVPSIRRRRTPLARSGEGLDNRSSHSAMQSRRRSKHRTTREKELEDSNDAEMLSDDDDRQYQLIAKGRGESSNLASSYHRVVRRSWPSREGQASIDSGDLDTTDFEKRSDAVPGEQHTKDAQDAGDTPRRPEDVHAVTLNEGSVIKGLQQPGHNAPPADVLSHGPSVAEGSMPVTPLNDAAPPTPDFPFFVSPLPTHGVDTTTSAGSRDSVEAKTNRCLDGMESTAPGISMVVDLLSAKEHGEIREDGIVARLQQHERALIAKLEAANEATATVESRRVILVEEVNALRAEAKREADERESVMWHRRIAANEVCKIARSALVSLERARAEHSAAGAASPALLSAAQTIPEYSEYSKTFNGEGSGPLMVMPETLQVVVEALVKAASLGKDQGDKGGNLSFASAETTDGEEESATTNTHSDVAQLKAHLKNERGRVRELLSRLDEMQGAVESALKARARAERRTAEECKITIAMSDESALERRSAAASRLALKEVQSQLATTNEQCQELLLSRDKVMAEIRSVRASALRTTQDARDECAKLRLRVEELRTLCDTARVGSADEAIERADKRAAEMNKSTSAPPDASNEDVAVAHGSGAASLGNLRCAEPPLVARVGGAILKQGGGHGVVHSAFIRLDSDRSGGLSASELRNGIQLVAPELPVEDVDAFIATMDQDQDGDVTFAEFFRILGDASGYGCGGSATVREQHDGVVQSRRGAAAHSQQLGGRERMRALRQETKIVQRLEGELRSARSKLQQAGV